MGLSNSKQDETIAGYWGGYASQYAEGKFYGGDELTAEILAHYNNTANSHLKNKLIDDLIEVMKNAGVNVSGSDRKAKIASMLAAIPNKKTNGKSFTSDAEQQSKLCKMLAGVINTQFGQVIDVNAPATLICQSVAEVVKSMETGLHTEFLAAQEEIKTIMHNLKALKELSEQNEDKLKEKIRKSTSDNKLTAEIQEQLDVIDMIKKETDRQLKMLSGIMSTTVSPAKQSILKLLKSEDQMFGFLDKVDADLKPGQAEFSDRLSQIFRKVGVTANYAEIIEKALSKVGLSMKEYAESTTLKALEERVQDLIVNKNLSDKEMHELLLASKLLYKNFSRRHNIAKMIKGQGENMDELENNIADILGETTGGAPSYVTYDDDADEDLTAADKQFRIRRIQRNEVLRYFNKQLSKHFEGMLLSLDILSQKVGGEIPISKQLDEFKDALDKFKDHLTRKGIFMILAGYYNDAKSQEIRDKFVAELKLIATHASVIMEMADYQSSREYFAQVHKEVTGLIALIDGMKDKLAEKFGRGEEITEEISGAYDLESTDSYSGGTVASDEKYLQELDDIQTVRKTTLNLLTAKDKFNANYAVGQMKENLKHSSSNFKSYLEAQGDLDAEAIGYQINKATIMEKAKLDKLDEISKQSPFSDDGADKKYYDKLILDTRKHIKEQYGAIKNFFRTVEAVNEYMKHFTDSLLKNHDDVGNIKQILDNVDVIKSWYKETDGDKLVKVFESFPATTSADSTDVHFSEVVYDKDGKKKNWDHYYETITKAEFKKVFGDDAKNLLGNPYIARLVLLKYDKSNSQVFPKETLKELCKRLALLKNIMSIFVYVGNKLGGNSLYKKTFMTPTQIYKNLCCYICESAFDVPGKLPADKSKEKPQYVKVLNVDTGDVTNADTKDKDNNVTFKGKALRYGISSGTTTSDAVTKFAQNFSYSLRHITEDTVFETDELKCDDLFEVTMKAICAKVLTVIDVYNVKNRPNFDIQYHPVRSILGGAEGTPEVLSEATELYMRLPLLAEFYKNLFGFNDSNAENGTDFTTVPYMKGDEEKKDIVRKFTMLPEVSGVFSGLIRILFKERKHLDRSNYSDNDIKQLITEINTIYKAMAAKYPSKTTMETIYEFVQEMNRRYGLLKKSDIDNYTKYALDKYNHSRLYDPTKVYDSEYKAFDEENDINIPLLPNEENSKYEVAAIAPSRKYENLDGSIDEAKLRSRKRRILAEQHKQLIYKMRGILDKHFKIVRKNNEAELPKFGAVIKSTVAQLKAESDPEKRCKLVGKLLRGVNVIGAIDESKYLMLHEMVITGLNTLSALHTILFDFQKFVVANEVNVPVRADGVQAAPSDLYDVPDINKFFITKTGNNDYIKELLSRLNRLTNDCCGLIKLKINQDFQLNFEPVKELVTSLLEATKENIELLRPHLDMESYLKKETPGTYYWLQEHLMEKIIVGKPRNLVEDNRLSDDKKAFKKASSIYIPLDRLQDILNATFNSIKSDADAKKIEDIQKTNIINNGLVDIAADKIKKIAINTGMGKLFTLYSGKGKIATHSHTVRHNLYSLDCEWNNKNQSLIMSFNQLVAKYIACLYDDSSEKMYLGAIDGFVNGAFRGVISNPLKAINDLGKIPATGEKLTSVKMYEVFKAIAADDQKFKVSTLKPSQPENGGILLKSLAVILKNIIDSKDHSGQSIRLHDNLGDVSIFTKEKMRALLPVFKNHFTEIINTSNFWRNIGGIEKLESDDYNKILTALIDGSKAMINCIDKVLRELGDNPVYTELYKGSIADYKSNYGKTPFMPLSSLTYLLNDNASGLNTPGNTLSSDAFKYQYAIRKIINDPASPITLDSAKGYANTLSEYNMLVHGRDQFDKKNAEKYLHYIVKSLRYINHINQTKVNLGATYETFTVAGPAGRNLPESINTSVVAKKAQSTYQIRVGKDKLDQVIALTEDSFKDKQIKKVVGDLTDLSKVTNLDNSKHIIGNIVELNIVPLDIHAMLKDIPLAELYNYAYTFDRLIIDTFYGLSGSTADELIKKLGQDGDDHFNSIYKKPDANLVVNAATEMLTTNLLKPYMKIKAVDTNQDWRAVANMYRGIDNTGLGRPKFMSDQIFNKALFGSIHKNDTKNIYGPDPSNEDTFQGNNMLVYVDKSGDFKSIDTSDGKYEYLQFAGMMRHNTHLIRNLNFLTNIYRTTRHRLHKELMYHKDITVSSHHLTNAENTDFFRNERHSTDIRRYAQ